MIRVVVTGSECTGKTTLSQALAAHFEVECAPEFVRQFVARKGAAPVYADVDAIARGQIAAEEALAARGGGLLILDTDLLSTVIYSRHYFGDCPAWIERQALERRADIYLLAGIDVPWVADGEQRDRGDRREEMQGLFVESLKRHRARWIELSGSPELRLRTALAAIEEVVAGRP